MRPWVKVSAVTAFLRLPGAEALLLRTPSQIFSALHPFSFLLQVLASLPVQPPSSRCLLPLPLGGQRPQIAIRGTRRSGDDRQRLRYLASPICFHTAIRWHR